MALIRLDGALDHPCALLDTRTPLDEWCHAGGYAQLADRVAAAVSPASFRFESVEGDDLLRLEAGQAAPGLVTDVFADQTTEVEPASGGLTDQLGQDRSESRLSVTIGDQHVQPAWREVADQVLQEQP